MICPRKAVLALLLIVILIGGCGQPKPTPAPPTVTSLPPSVMPIAPTSTPTSPPATTPTPIPSEESPATSLSADEIATLSSLTRVDGYPLYTMHYHGSYNQEQAFLEGSGARTWACSLFAALGDADNMFYGRNFDWDFSPALLLFTAPPDGYASVSMVDIAYLGFDGSKASTVADLPLDERETLLYAPFIPFDGLNECGLAIGMAAVSPGEMRPDPDKETINSLAIIREMLDHACNVDEALAILQSYNIDMSGGPPIHYLLADRSGRSLLIEFYQGETHVLPNETPWHQATNFLRVSVDDVAQGLCWRYDKIGDRLAESGGRLTAGEAMGLLSSVAQHSTQWSVVYGLSTGQIDVVMGQEYAESHSFTLNLLAE
jgi:hypothetical protein